MSIKLTASVIRVFDVPVNNKFYLLVENEFSFLAYIFSNLLEIIINALAI